MVAIPIRRHLWFDELVTYYISGAPSFARMFEAVNSGIDYNPPLIYLIIRTWQSICGGDEVLSRIPVFVAFIGSSALLFTFLRRWFNPFWAACPPALFWCTGSFTYATELRPYSLMLVFGALALLGWDRTSGRHRALALTWVALGSAGLSLSHVLGIFPVAAICLGEVGRERRRQKIDWMLWICLLVPLITVLLYLPFIKRFDGGLYPAAFQGGLHRLGYYAKYELEGIWKPLVGCVVAARLSSTFRADAFGRIKAFASTEYFWLLIGFILIPISLNGIMMVKHIPFFERYAIVSSLADCVIVVLIVGAFSGFSSKAGCVVLLTLISFGFWKNSFDALESERRLASQVNLDGFNSNLPLVVASGVNYLEVDRYEKPELLARVYYLTDREAAARISHATLFDTLIPLCKSYFPIRARVSKYEDFLEQHSRFFLFANPEWPEEWVAKRLREQGAVLRPVSPWIERYKDGGIVFEVRMTR